VELVTEQDGGELPAAGLRELGRRLAELATDLLTRASELDGHPVAPLMIDAPPGS
jgi:hypothetical protein